MTSPSYLVQSLPKEIGMGSLSRNTRSRPFFKELTDKFDGATNFYPSASGGLLDSAGRRTFFSGNNRGRTCYSDVALVLLVFHL